MISLLLPTFITVIAIYHIYALSLNFSLLAYFCSCSCSSSASKLASHTTHQHQCNIIIVAFQPKPKYLLLETRAFHKLLLESFYIN